MPRAAIGPQGYAAWSDPIQRYRSSLLKVPLLKVPLLQVPLLHVTATRGAAPGGGGSPEPSASQQEVSR